MSRRARAVGFAVAAALAAASAAAIADGYGRGVAGDYGALRPVVVAAAPLPRGARIDPERAARAMEVRRVPARFAPTGALRDPAEALGLEAAAPIPAGSYVLAAQLRPGGSGGAGPRLGRGRAPVEIAVTGVEALAAAGARPGSARVDVVVTTEPRGSGPGRTYVAAAGVPLLGFGPRSEAAAEPGAATAVLGLTRAQALRLIAAESFARKLTILPRG